MRLVEKRNGLKSVLRLAALALLCGVAQAGEIIQITLSPVGDPGNAADITGYGGVSYNYDMGTYDVTTGQYAAFLNSVAVSGDPYGLYASAMATDLRSFGIVQTSTSGGYSYSVFGNPNVPVFDINWGSCARFVNWLQNGQPCSERPGTTESGTYALNGGTSNAALMAVTRSPSATWVLPALDEWYKAAYYVGGGTNAGYWLYPTQSNDSRATCSPRRGPTTRTSWTATP